MIIYHIGHEAGLRIEPLAGYGGEMFDPNWSRTCIAVRDMENGSAYIDFKTPLNPASHLCFHGLMMRHWPGDRASGLSLLTFLADDNTKVVDLITTSSTGITLRLMGDSATDVSLDKFININAFTIDVDLKASYGFLICKLYVNSFFYQATWNGNCPSIASIKLGVLCNYPYYPIDGWSELIVANVETRGWRVKTLPPTGSGQYTESDGGFANIKEIPEDNLKAEFTAIDQRLTVAHAGLGASGGVVAGCALQGVAKADAAIALHPMLRIGTIDNVGTDPVTIEPAASPIQVLYQENPVTGEGWTKEEISALQYGFQAKSK